MRFGYYIQMVAAFLMLSLGHYFAAAFLPVADCDETYNFVEPMHYLLYGSGKQTWEQCPQYALRSWLFAWLYAWPAAMVRGVPGLSSVDVYYYLRILVSRIACLYELFFIYSVWSTFSGKHAVLALALLLLNYPIPHAAVSVLPTSFAMCQYFAVLGCWLHTGRATSREGPVSRGCKCCVATAVFLTVAACTVGWPFAGLVTFPIGIDILIRFPLFSSVCLIVSLCVTCGVSLLFDSAHYCRWTLSAWNVMTYNIFGGAERGPHLYGTEPWYFLLKNLLLNFNLVFLVSIAAPAVILLRRGRRLAVVDGGTIPRGRQLLYVSPFFLWVGFWTTIAHKEERFLAPAYPFMILSAVLALQVCFHGELDISSSSVARRAESAEPVHPHQPGRRQGSHKPQLRRRRRRLRSGSGLMVAGGIVFLLCFGAVSLARALAVYRFYSGPERLFYDRFAVLQREAAAKVAAGAGQYNVCVGREWYRMPSSFFIDSAVTAVQFLKMEGQSALQPVPFRVNLSEPTGLLQPHRRHQRQRGGSGAGNGPCVCNAENMNDLNQAIPAQYVTDPVETCDAVFDSLSPSAYVSEATLAAEKAALHMDTFTQSLLSQALYEATERHSPAGEQRRYSVDDHYAVLDVDVTPLWCRVLYLPLGLSERCAVWRPLVLHAKRVWSTQD